MSVEQTWIEHHVAEQRISIAVPVFREVVICIVSKWGVKIIIRVKNNTGKK
jgi:hypothetical protein